MAKKTVMVVDDEELTVDLIAELLKREGINVVKAFNGEECLQKLKTVKPDAIILDFYLPGMSGREALEKIRQNPKLSKTKVAFLTCATFSEAGLSEIDRMEVIDYIKKPFDNADFVRRIKALLK